MWISTFPCKLKHTLTQLMYFLEYHPKELIKVIRITHLHLSNRLLYQKVVPFILSEKCLGPGLSQQADNWYLTKRKGCNIHSRTSSHRAADFKGKVSWDPDLESDLNEPHCLLEAENHMERHIKETLWTENLTFLQAVLQTFTILR